MRLFDFLKKEPHQETSISSLQAILNDPSKTLDEQNAAYLAIRDEEERRLNAAYDFNSIEGIRRIPVPCHEVNGNSSTGCVEYYLRGKCFANHWDAGRTELALACLYKAQELMFISNMIWKRRDFLRIVVYLHRAGKHEEADRELAQIDDFFAKQDIHHDRVLRTLSSAKYLHTDLLEANSSSPCCEECAKYVNRIYSISGKDKRFPALPQEFLKKGSGHHLSCISLWPFTYGRSEPSFECTDVVKFSNRKFVDERTLEEVKEYNDCFSMMQEEAKKEAEQEEHMIENAKLWRQDMETLEWLKKYLPQICPKSISGFRRMRTTHSKNYQKLVAEAAKLGKKLS